jgi:thiamine biosynthesis lipoprotein
MRFLFLTAIWIFLIEGCKSKSVEYIHDKGFIFGTVYSIVYDNSAGDLHDEIRQLLLAVNNSLSPFEARSIISRFNRGEENVVADSYFIDVFTKAVEVNRISNGAFDITLAPIINAWGFGFEKYDTVNDEIIDSLMQFVGMENVYIENNIIKRKKEGVTLNASAIAKGHAVDVVANFLRDRGVKNFMIDIGGEIAAEGVNPKGIIWRIAIAKPIYDDTNENGEFMMTLNLSGKALATSGNYHNFFIRDGKKYGHTINPETGRPVQLSILSASIIADDCMTADAYSTVCMVIGIEASIALIESIPNIEGLFIYKLPDCETLRVVYTSGFEQYIYVQNDR